MINGMSTLLYSAEMDVALLWLTAILLGYRTTWLRLSLAAIIGSVPTLWVLLRQNLYALPWGLGLMWPTLMLMVALRGLPKRFWLKSYFLFLVMAVFVGGMFTALVSWQGRVAWAIPYLDWAPLVPPVLVLLGRRFPKRTIRQLVGREAYGEMRLRLNQRVLSVPVLWDSGNELVEPESHRSVVIVEASAAASWLPRDLLQWCETVQASHAVPVDAPEEWQGKVAVVDFRTINGSGQMPIIYIDEARGNLAGVWHQALPVAVGISPRPISSDGSYRALATPKSLIHYPNERVGA